jgi:hypothetical protein
MERKENMQHGLSDSFLSLLVMLNGEIDGAAKIFSLMQLA